MRSLDQPPQWNSTLSPGRAADFLARSLRSLFDPYRPECHYMRGPGPKWRAKHNLAPPILEPPISRAFSGDWLTPV
jgi:hypothetical protein